MTLRNGSLWHDRKRTFLGLPWSFTKYELTEERLFITKGFFNITVNEVRLYRIKDVKLTKSFGQRLFGLGTISVCSSDDNMKNFDILNIKLPEETIELLSDKVELQRNAHRVVAREIIGDYDQDDYDDTDED